MLWYYYYFYDLLSKKFLSFSKLLALFLKLEILPLNILISLAKARNLVFELFYEPLIR